MSNVDLQTWSPAVLVPMLQSIQVIWGGQGTLMRTDEEDFMRRWTPVVRELAGPTRTAMLQKVLMIVDMFGRFLKTVLRLNTVLLSGRSFVNHIFFGRIKMV